MPITCAVVVHCSDFACGTSEYCLNRELAYWANTQVRYGTAPSAYIHVSTCMGLTRGVTTHACAPHQFCVDTFHAYNHTCPLSYRLRNQLPHSKDINSSSLEQYHSFLQRVTMSVARMSFANYMWMTSLAIHV